MPARRFLLLLALFGLLGTAWFRHARAEENPPPAGLGIALHIENGHVLVHAVLPDTAAADSEAIHVGDRILGIAEGNDEAIDVNGMQLAEVVAKIRGAKGMLVRLTIVPTGKMEADSHVISLRRGDVKGLSEQGDGKLFPAGTAAPDFKFTSLLEDKAGALSQYSGKIVVVEFWTSWCGPCIRMLDRLDAMMDTHPQWQGLVEVLAVNLDEAKDDAVKRVEEKKWSNLSMVRGSIDLLKTYHINGFPTMYLVNQSGKVIAADHHLELEQLLEPLLTKPKN